MDVMDDQDLTEKCFHCNQNLEPNKTGGVNVKAGRKDWGGACRFCRTNYAHRCTACGKGQSHG